MHDSDPAVNRQPANAMLQVSRIDLSHSNILKMWICVHGNKSHVTGSPKVEMFNSQDFNLTSTTIYYFVLFANKQLHSA